MAKHKGNTVEVVDLGVVEAGGIVMLEAIETGQEDSGQGVKRQFSCYFRHDAEYAKITPGPNVRVLEMRTVGNCLWLLCESSKLNGKVKFHFAGKEVRFLPRAPMLDRFADKNTLVAVRNGENVGLILDWLDYHGQHHDMQGAVILDRSKPKNNRKFVRKLGDRITSLKQPCQVTVVQADTPFGKDGAPPEPHPFATPGAPGKDRMEEPEGDAWEAHSAQGHIYEILRYLLLNKARAVANIDVYDMLNDDPKGTAFDAAVEADGGVIPLGGRQCYPWRTRKGKAAGFADHICVQFDQKAFKQRWCVAPSKLSSDAIWRLIRIGGVHSDINGFRGFYRFMALRHRADSVSQIVPKSSLVEHEPLIKFAKKRFGFKPVRMPEISLDKGKARGRAAILTCMKNEGPFILEWLAYHRAIGFDDVLVYSNDCEDGTDTLLDLLQANGYLQHRDNPFKSNGLKPQHAAMQAAEDEEIIQKANWLVNMDVDEYVTVKCGDHTLDALFAAVPDANMIAMTWRLFGNNDIHEYRDEFLTEKFTRCAWEMTNKPHQAFGFKTLFKNIGVFKKLGVHRPKGLNPQLWDEINWVNGSGQLLPKEMYRNAWRSTNTTYGYDLVSLNHYAVRSAESFLVKRDRGRVNHVDRDQGLAYWFRMNNNATEDTAIHAAMPLMRAEYDRLLADPEIAAAHAYSVQKHRDKIDALRATERYATFYKELTGPRMEKLSRLHSHFGANVFLMGPDVIPPEIVEKDADEEFFFTVEKGETAH